MKTYLLDMGWDPIWEIDSVEDVAESEVPSWFFGPEAEANVAAILALDVGQTHTDDLEQKWTRTA